MIRFVIFSAVSTAPQTQGDSLGEQESLCRAGALARGWQESGGPFVVRWRSSIPAPSLDRPSDVWLGRGRSPGLRNGECLEGLGGTGAGLRPVLAGEIGPFCRAFLQP